MQPHLTDLIAWMSTVLNTYEIVETLTAVQRALHLRYVEDLGLRCCRSVDPLRRHVPRSEIGRNHTRSTVW